MRSKAVLMALMLAALVSARGQSLDDVTGNAFAPQTASEREKERAERDKERAAERAEREDELYNDGTEYLDEGEWQKALGKFDQLIEMKSRRMDAAMYWKAYALSKLGRRQEALATLATLKRGNPQSKWVKDASALEQEINTRQGVVPKPETIEDCELKVMAINSLMNSDEERAVPMVEKLLNSNTCPKAKNQALFVLSQSDSPRATAALMNIARGNAHPELQIKAIRNLGLNGNQQNKQALVEIYKSTNDTAVKRTVLQAFLTGGAEDETLAVATGDPDPDMRRAAIHQLGAMGAHKQLHQLYQSARSIDEKKAIMNACGIGGDIAFLAQVARNGAEQMEVRKAALNGLGIGGGGRYLFEVYNADTNPEIRKAAINGMFISGACSEMVTLVKKETNSDMKRALIQQLSLMDCREARDYMMEILNK
ncbi:MAG TPA: HEAT repeat domain-containing protein [Terriglobales bacterium]|nr:HEAT repeat domain-containing protein [Terriglobales bacterium]